MALLLLLVACSHVEKVDEIRSVSITSTAYPGDNYFTYVKDGTLVDIITDEVDVCTAALTEVRKTYPYVELPDGRRSGDLMVYAVEGGLNNDCYYII